MKGYFASLAKQSGLRVSGKKTGPGILPAQTADTASPLHREETVWISPRPLESARTDNAPAQKTRKTPHAGKRPVTRQDDIPAAETKNAVNREEKLEGARETKNTEVGREPVKTEIVSIDIPPVQSIPARREATVEHPFAAGEKPGDLALNEQKIVVEDVSKVITSPGPGAGEFAQITQTEPAEAPRFFVKTAEIIEKGEAAPADIGSILFQEVREWVSGGSAAEDSRPSPRPETVEILTASEVPMAAPEPGVVVVGRRMEPENPEGPPAIEEQSFNLSIGTISVIIEDTEKSPEPVQTVRTPQALNGSTSEPKREFSRLSRNYL